MNEVPLWTVVLEWFRRVVLRRVDDGVARDWFAELWSYAEMGDDEVPMSSEPALTPTASSRSRAS
jgi:hypothetical protein